MTARTDLVDVLATYRLTRLATTDSITEPIRGALIRMAYVTRDGADEAGERIELHGGTWTQLAQDDLEAPWLAQLLICRWCLGWWISLAVLVVRCRHPRLWRLASEPLALAAASALVASLES